MRVNSDEKSWRNTRAGSWLDDYTMTIPACDIKIFNSTLLLEKKIRRQIFLNDIKQNKSKSV